MSIDAARAKSLFLAASGFEDSAGRAAYVDQECDGDADLRARVEALLKADDAAPPLSDAGGPTGDPGATQFYPDSKSQVGQIIAGRYKLLQRIGEGGMGTVWMADQIQPVKRRVAVKLISLDRGNSRMILSRFEAERQAIALMDHPHIARLLDAGTTDGGHPYFVMELVKGVSLTEYCDSHKLSIPKRLVLFQQVCSAVQHAHQKGIIHRDIKPSNILVENHDGTPVPKVIDFGLAKAASGMQLTEHTLFTAFGSVMGTPSYMAPEQATFNAVDIDTRADVYSLGVILYELLTGTTPITRETVKKVAFDEVLKLVREQDAPRPSMRLTTAETKPETAVNRSIDQIKLSKLVKGDLDCVVLKALEKDRNRRYQTAAGLSAEVQRYLDGEPVQAVPLSASYHLRKFIRKHRLGVIAAAVVLITLLAGVATSTSLYFKALANEKKAASTLAELRSTAPTYISQARSLFAEQKSSEALAAIEFALRLDPDNADYNLLLAQKLQALGRLPEAIEAFTKVLAIRPKDESATSNLELCRRLEKTKLPSGQLTSAGSIEVLGALVAQKRTDDLWPLQRTVGREAMANRALILSRTKNLQTQGGWYAGRITQLNDGTFSVNLGGMAVTDLSWVSGLPISEMFLPSTPVVDVAPLAGLPLRKLDMSWTNLRDIEPLRGMKLVELQLALVGVTDLTPLAGMPLENLDLTMCNEVENLGPLAGLPLKELRLRECRKITDFSPLSQCAQLERIALPAAFQNIGLLRKLPKLKKVLLDDSSVSLNWESVLPIEEFLPVLEQRLVQDAARLTELRAALAGLGMPKDQTNSVRLSADGLITLDLQNYAIADVAFLKGLRLRALFLLSPNNQFSDLSPLTGAPIWNIGIRGSQITDLNALNGCPLTCVNVIDCPSLKDISALKGKPLDNVTLENSGVDDLRPFAGCLTLRLCYINGSPVSNLSPLAGCSGLQELGAERCPLSDLTSLAKLANLRVLKLDNSKVQDLGPISNLKLRLLSTCKTSISDFTPMANITSLEELYASGTEVRDLSPLSKLTSLTTLDLENSQADNLRPVPPSILRVLKIGATQITDFAPLTTMTELEDLSATGLPLRDLSVLTGCRKLRMLYLGKIPATDIRPICNLPLNTLHLDDSQISDVAPLVNCKTLEYLLIPKDAKGVEALRNLPRLQRLSYSWDVKAWRISQTVKEFWAEYDRKESKR